MCAAGMSGCISTGGQHLPATDNKMNLFVVFGLVLASLTVQGAFGAGPLCYTCFYYSEAEDGVNLQEAFTNSFRHQAPRIMAVFKNAGTVDSTTKNLLQCANADPGMPVRQCNPGQKCLSYTYAFMKPARYMSQEMDKWVMTWRDCVDATFDCDSSPVQSLEARCCTSDLCNDAWYNSESLFVED